MTVRELDWPTLADKMLRSCFPGLWSQDREDAHAVAMLSGWQAAQSCPYDSEDITGYVFRAMRNGVTDHFRRELGRKGQKMGRVISLDTPLPGAYATLADVLPDDETARACQQIEDLDEVASLLATTRLTAAQRRWVDWTLEDRPAVDLAHKLGITQDAVAQSRHYALTRLRRTALAQAA